MNANEIKAIFLSVLMILSMVAIAGASGVTAESDETVQAEQIGGGGVVDAAAESTANETPSKSADTVERGGNLGEANGSQDVLIMLEQADVGPVERGSIRNELQRHAELTQGPVVQELHTLDSVDVESQFWITNMVSATIDADERTLEQISAIEGVESVHKNYEITPPEPAETEGINSSALDVRDGESEIGADHVADHGKFTYGLEQINVPEFWDEYGRGENATVAIMDQGVAESHPDIDATETVAIDNDGTVLPDGVSPGYHGTHVASTATGGNASGTHIGVAPEAELYAADVFSEGGQVGSLIGAIEWAVENDADVISGSVGFGGGGSPPLHQQPLIEPIRHANEMGTSVVASSSNSGDGLVGGFGANFDAFSIGASNNAEAIGSFSSGGLIDKYTGQPDWDPWAYANPAPQSYENPPVDWPNEWIKPDVSAPGVNVYGADIPGSGGNAGGDYTSISGTSMAAPHVAGAIGLLQSATDEHLDDEEIEAALAETATKPDDWNESDARWEIANKDSRYGVGIIDVKAAADLLTGNGTATVEGTVTDDSGEAVSGAEITTANGLVTATDDTGNYSLEVAAGRTVELTVDKFGYAPSTQTVEVSADAETVTAPFDVDSLLATELVSEQPAYAAFGGEFSVGIRTANAEEYTVELTDESNIGADNVTLGLNGTEISLGETVDISDTDELNLTVEVADTVSANDTVGFEHNITGVNDDVVVESGPTQMTEEVDPSFFELSNIDADDPFAMEPDVPVSGSVEVTNTGQEPGTSMVSWHFGGGEATAGPVTNVVLGPGESTTVETGNVTFLDDWFDGGQEITHSFETVRSGGIFPIIDDEIKGEMTLLEPDTELFFVENASDAMAPNESTVDLNATVTNLGELDGTQTVELRIDGEMVDSQEVTVGSAENTTVTFEDVSMPDEAGPTNYSVVAADDSAQGELFTVEPDATMYTVENVPDQEVNSDSDDVSVQITNAGTENATQTAELEVDGDVVATRDVDVAPTSTETVTFEGVDLPETDGAYEYTVTTNDDSGTGWLAVGLALGEYTVTVVEGTTDEFGQATAATFEPYLPPTYDIQTVKAPEMSGVIDETDIFVAQHFYPVNRNETALTELIRTVEHDPTTGIVYLEQPWGSEAIRDRSSVIGDPAERRGSFSAAPPVNYTISEAGGDHPIFDGVGEAGDTVTVADPLENIAWFEGASGETLATVSNDGGEGGPSVTVDPETGSVLVSSIAVARYVAPANITTNGRMILANSVEHANDRRSQAGSIVGTVTDEDTGEPVEGATVRAENGNGDVYTAVSDETGEYRMIGVAPGQFVINPIDAPPGYEPDAFTQVDVGEIVTVDHEVPPMDSVITGTVVDADGDPIGDAEVVDADQGAFNATTGSNGTFMIDSDAFERGDTVAIRANADGYERSNIMFVELAEPGANEVEFTLEEPAHFDVSIDEDSDVDVMEGDDVVVNVTIENAGDRSATQSVDVNVPGLGSTSRSVPLDGGASTTESFTVGTSQGDAGTYTATAASDDDSDNRSVDVAPADEAAAHFSVGISGTTAPVTAGENVSVDLTVENVGDAAGTQDIELDIPELGSNATTVSLESGESTTRSLSVTTAAGDAGAYNATVSSRDDSADRTVEVDPVSGQFYAVDIVETNEPVDGGSDLIVDVSVENVGDSAGEQPVELAIPTVGNASANVSLAAGESATESFAVGTSESDTGTHTATVSSANDSDSTAVTVEESGGGGGIMPPPAPAPDGPEFEISTVDPAVSELEPGDAFEVNATVENVGDETGTAEVRLSLDGAEVGTGSITLADGEAVTVTFDATAPETAGDVDLTAVTADDETTTTVTVDAPADTGSDEGSDDTDPVDPDDSIPGFGGVVALLGLVVAATMHGRMRE